MHSLSLHHPWPFPPTQPSVTPLQLNLRPSPSPWPWPSQPTTCPASIFPPHLGWPHESQFTGRHNPHLFIMEQPFPQTSAYIPAPDTPRLHSPSAPTVSSPTRDPSDQIITSESSAHRLSFSNPRPQEEADIKVLEEHHDRGRGRHTRRRKTSTSRLSHKERASSSSTHDRRKKSTRTRHRRKRSRSSTTSRTSSRRAHKRNKRADHSQQRHVAFTPVRPRKHKHAAPMISNEERWFTLSAKNCSGSKPPTGKHLLEAFIKVIKKMRFRSPETYTPLRPAYTSSTP